MFLMLKYFPSNIIEKTMEKIIIRNVTLSNNNWETVDVN